MKKKVLALVLTVAIIALMIPISAFAYTEGEYEDVDYSTTLTVGTETSHTIADTDLLIFVNTASWNGFASGYTVSLEAGKTYQITAKSEDQNAGYTDRAVAVIAGGTLTGNESTELLDYQTKYLDGSTTIAISLSFTPSVSGNYRILTWGYTEDSDGNDIFGGTVKVKVTESRLNEVTISNKQELLDFAEAVNSDEDGLYACTSVELTQDIDMTGEDWDGIDFFNTITWNGNGHSIKGLSKPLIWQAQDASINDLSLPEVNIALLDEDSRYGYGLYDIGALIGDITEKCSLANCSVSGTLTVTSTSEDEEDGGLYDIGGLIGDIDCDGARVENCFADVTITLTSNMEVESVGGLVGECDDGTSFIDCRSEGTINISSKRYVDYIGGLGGYFEDENQLIHCSSTVTIGIATDENISAYALGGLVGYIDEAHLFVNCYAWGNISLTGNIYAENVGGLVGGSDCCGDNEFLNCYAIGDVEGSEDVGGFIGEAYDGDSFYNCYAAGTVKYKEAPHETFDNRSLDFGTAEDYIGAFIGYTNYPDDISFFNCYAHNTNELPMFWYGSDPYGADDVEGLNDVDFSDQTKVDNMTKALNGQLEKLSADFDEDLLKWGGKNSKNGPVLADLTVTFVDDDGTVIKIVTGICYGQDLTDQAPAFPERAGFTVKWNQEFDKVTGNMTIKAVYAPANPDTGAAGVLPIAAVTMLSLAAVLVLKKKKEQK